MANKITPASEKSGTGSSSSPMMDMMNTYVKSKFGYNTTALTNAKLTGQNERAAYQIDMWTLMECRKTKRMTQPYNGENIPSATNRNEWEFDFDRPPTDLKKTKNDVRTLEQTRWTTICRKCSGFCRYMCSSCKGDGGKPCYHCKVKALTDTDLSNKKTCSHCHDSNVIVCNTCKSTGMVDCKRCKGCGKLLHWYQMKIKWYSIHSVSYQSNTKLPMKIIPKLIRKAPGNKDFWEIDQKWTKTDTFDKYFQNTFVKQHPNSQINIEKLTEDFNKKHGSKAKKNCRIVQFKSIIQKLDITEVEYEAKDFTNKEDKEMGDKFKFYKYGQGKKGEPLIYENDYPMNTCGCFGPKCAHHSVCCTIA
ncbi:hypothetical protein I4U23_006029 [Adineta vaga]|nr:hypothetical protein I4U23_006029 [Adineta vaga]